MYTCVFAIMPVHGSCTYTVDDWYVHGSLGRNGTIGSDGEKRKKAGEKEMGVHRWLVL